MTTATPLRVGLIGAGMVSFHHLSAWAGIADARIVGIADPEGARARSRAAEFGIAGVFASAEHLIAETAPHAIDIATPVETHRPLCTLAAQNGIHVLCQKPLAGSAAEARETVRAVGGRVRLMVHENWRFRPTYRRVKEWLEADEIGAPCAARLHVASSGLVPDASRRLPALVRQPFLAALPRLLVFEVLIHHLDVLRWLFGDLTVVAARLGRHCGSVRGDDTAAVLLQTSAGLPVQLSGCLCVPDAPEGIDDHLEVVGRRGVIRIGGTSASLSGARRLSARWDFGDLYAASFEGALRHFATALKEDRPFETEATDNLRVLAIVEEIYSAANRPRTG